MPQREYIYLEQRPEKTRQQLYIKGRTLPAAAVYSEMLTAGQTPEEAARDWDLPLEAIMECIEYCNDNLELLSEEAEEERNWLKARGIEAEVVAAGIEAERQQLTQKEQSALSETSTQESQDSSPDQSSGDQ